MGIYKRGDSPFWWVTYYDEGGRRKMASTKTADEKEARKVEADIIRRVAALKAAGAKPNAPLTVERYAEKWLREREERGLAIAADDKARLAHALPRIGPKRLEDVTPADLRDLMRHLERYSGLAPRTRLHVYGALRTLFADAQMDGLITTSPAILSERRGELPKNVDRVATWRSSAVFSREEVAQLVCDARIPSERRVRYAFAFFTGVRIGELAALRWGDYQPQALPLGRLSVSASFQTKRKRLKGTKTGVARLVPIHPALAPMLAEWRASGWVEWVGRTPEPHDFIFPRQSGAVMSASSAWHHLLHDLETLGLPRRRIHDTRRTFISLALADGARRDILRWVTHGPEGDVVSLYTTLPWVALCGEVEKLQFNLPSCHFQWRSVQVPAPESRAVTETLRSNSPEGGKMEAAESTTATGGAQWSPLASNEGQSQREMGSTGHQQQPVSDKGRSNVADESDPGGHERRAVKQGFTVTPPWKVK